MGGWVGGGPGARRRWGGHRWALGSLRRDAVVRAEMPRAQGTLKPSQPACSYGAERHAQFGPVFTLQRRPHLEVAPLKAPHKACALRVGGVSYNFAVLRRPAICRLSSSGRRCLEARSWQALAKVSAVDAVLPDWHAGHDRHGSAEARQGRAVAAAHRAGAAASQPASPLSWPAAAGCKHVERAAAHGEQTRGKC